MIQMILLEAHSFRYFIHPSTIKIYRDLRQHYWWCGIKNDISDFVSLCVCCQLVKSKHLRSDFLIYRLPIPEWRWELITIYFVIGYHIILDVLIVF